MTWIKRNKFPIIIAAGILALIFSLSGLLTLVSSSPGGSWGWAPFFGVLVAAAGLLWGGWWLIRGEHPPNWLAGLLLGAALLRLTAGMFWFVALPVGGYASPAEQGGYIMADAHHRDGIAWELAESGKPLFRAFSGNYRRADQYGGLLYLSAGIYRVFGGQQHQPLMVVTITAAFSALALLFTWAFVKRAWGTSAALVAAWVVALYPEAVMLGSSQMREAFSMTLVAGAFLGMLRYWQDRSLSGIFIILFSLAGSLLLSPPLTALLTLMLAIQLLALRRDMWFKDPRRQRRLWLLLLVIALLVTAGVWASWGSFAPQSVTNPLELVGWWAKKTAEWQAYLTEQASGWVQKVFAATPEWSHTTLIILWGIVQPFMPAAIADVSGSLLWRGVALWRALGWTLMLLLVLYAPWRVIRWNDKWELDSKGSSISARALVLIVWLGIVIAAFRGGGDLWDNPRYRVVFISLQAALFGWVWAAQRLKPDKWLWRILVGIAIAMIWFIPWYLERYIYLNWPIQNVFVLLSLAIASMILYWIIAVLKDRRSGDK